MTKTLMLRAIAVLAALLLFVTLATPALAQDDSDDPDDGDDGETVTMTLLHNNDGESKLLPDIDGGFPGIARFTQTLQDLGTSTDADILLRVTSGDNFLASKEFSVSLARDDEPLYDSIALSGLYEAMGLGNHDFDFGPDVTARFIEGFAPSVPFLAANIDVSAEDSLQALADEGRIAPSIVITDPASGLEVGVIGALTPRLPNISSPRDVVVDPDVAGAVNAEAAALIEQGVDRIVLVSHLQGLAEDRALVPELSGVDIVVAGGGDELLKNDGDTCLPDEEAFDSYPLLLTDADGNEVPVVTAPGGYRCIGRLDVTFDAEGNLVDWQGTSIGVELDADPESYVLDNVETPLTEALAELSATIIGTSDVDLDGRRESVRTGPSNEGELLATAILEAGQAGPDFGGQAADVAIQNGGGIRNDAVIPAGELSAADTFDIAPFANFVVTVPITRERFRDVLELAVSGLPDAEGRFPQIAGFTMEVDATLPARQVDHDGECDLIGDEGSRVQSVTLDDGTVIVDVGQVEPGDDLVLATIDFLAGGGDCYPLADLEATKVGVSYQQALATLIEDVLGGEVTAEEFPAGGSRSIISGTGGSADSDDPDADDPDADDADATDPDDPDADDPDADDPDATEDLPNTGSTSRLFLIVALTIAVGGAMVVIESRRTSKLSLANRLTNTAAWSPDDEPQQ